MKCGLLGRSLGHSYSPRIHRFLGNYPYHLFEREPDQVEAFLRSGDYAGINVTIPYKKTVIPFLDALTPTAEKLGAVNTIVRRSDGTLLGHNTDYYGFASMVYRSGLDVSGKKALVLGSGGASNTVCAVLSRLGADIVVISRSGENNYSNLHLHSDASIIVNTTPVGMYPNNGLSPVDLNLFPHLEGVLDLIYNPAKTKLLLDAEKRGLKWENGLWMLVAQAKEAAECFTGAPISDDCIGKIHTKLSGQMQNIVLIGMPGCGKTTVGKLLAEITGRRFVDADSWVEQEASCSIPDIFAKSGETVFRHLETKALEELGKQSGLVIATGGGCVTQSRNYPLLHQNGCLFWLQRPLDTLPAEGRPLSQRTRADQMYAIRKPLYEAFADHTIQNRGTPEDAVSSIVDLLEGCL